MSYFSLGDSRRRFLFDMPVADNATSLQPAQAHRHWLGISPPRRPDEVRRKTSVLRGDPEHSRQNVELGITIGASV